MRPATAAPPRPRLISSTVAGVARRPITTEDQSATFIELFFDLVFVYAVTQTVGLAHEELSWAGATRGLAA